LIVVGLALSTAGRWQAGAVVAGYVLLTLTYSTVWKHVAVIDLVAVAGGFVLRAISGAVAIDVLMSTWFLLCTSFASLFIVTGKRYAELRELGEDAALSRSTLDDYSLTFLRTVLNISVGAALVTYCIWAFDITGTTRSRYPFYELSIVPMLCALLRYTLVIEQGHGAAPEEIFAVDRTLQILGVLWVVIFGLGVYLR
jgi:decaprenyl-phosphate phosphoribosyltransferase